MKKNLLLIFVIALITACSSDDDSGSDDKITSAEITLINENNEPISGVMVYAYQESTWEVIGDDPNFANFEKVSNDEGIAIFSNLTTDLTFNEISNYQQTFRFSVHYTQNDIEKVKVKAISFDLGDDKSEQIILD